MIEFAMVTRKTHSISRSVEIVESHEALIIYLDVTLSSARVVVVRRFLAIVFMMRDRVPPNFST